MARGLCEEARLKCVICKHGHTSTGLGTFTSTDDSLTLIVKRTPASICDNCGEQYFNEDVVARLLEMADQAERDGIEIQVRNYVPSEQNQMDGDQRQYVEEFIRALGLTSGQLNRTNHQGGYRLYVATTSKRQPRFGYVRLYVRGQDAGKMVVYANGDFSDPEGRFTPQPKNPKDAWYKFWPDDKAARDYAVKVVKSAYESNA